MRIRLFDQNELDLVEIQILNENEIFVPFSETARYIQSAVFSVFIYCFELSKPDFDYLKTNMWEKEKTVTLRNHLFTHLTRLGKIDCADDLEIFTFRFINGIEFMNALKSNDPEWRLSWEKARDKLVIINEELIDLVDSCIDEDKVLWVKGY